MMMQIEVESPDLTARRNEPVSCGIPWPRGLLRDVGELRLFDEAGQQISIQARTLDRWSDNSVRWALLDWQATVVTKTNFRVEVGPDHSDSVDSPKIRLTQDVSAVTIDTGVASFVIRSGGGFPCDSIQIAGQRVIDPAQTGLMVESDDGNIFRPRLDQVEILESGPLKVVIQVRGLLSDTTSGTFGCRLLSHLHFHAGLGAIRIDLTLHNPRQAGHQGNLWSLGEKGSIYFRDAALSIALAQNAEPTRIHYSPEQSVPFQSCHRPLEIYQDSSGGENWQSTVHVNRLDVVPNSFRGYRIRHDSLEENGLRATPIVIVENGVRWLGIAMEYFWQNFPKAIEATPDSLTLRLFPKQYADVHELQGGEQKTHNFWVSFARDSVTDEPLAWCRQPLRCHATPSWYCSTGAVRPLTPKADDPSSLYLQLVDAAIKGDDTIYHKREVIDEYGWRNFGEIYADHEAVFHSSPHTLVSHYNNQYDPIAGFALQFLRSADWRWWLLMHELALHVRDIDVYHTDGDKSAYNRGLFWHTCHYVDARTSTHRAYPKRTKNVSGGGPSGGHNYAHGLMLHYFLTGDHLSRTTAVELAQWSIDMDDGRKTIFRWLAGGYTGHATASGSPHYHGPGRAPGNSVNTLLDGFRLTGNRAYLNKAEQIIRRCIHPNDNVESRNLLDAENKWFYTMFLQAIGRYVDMKAEWGQIDRMYAYARASLLHHARWMAEHEYPYLEKPEILEYPTETWPAQDMRKSEVFEAAARLAESSRERDRFLERSRFFFESSTTTLAEMPTRSLARPVVILLSNGLARADSQLNHDFPSLPTPQASYDFGSPESFIPQKTLAVRRVKLLVGFAGVVIVIVAILLTISTLN